MPNLSGLGLGGSDPDYLSEAILKIAQGGEAPAAARPKPAPAPVFQPPSSSPKPPLTVPAFLRGSWAGRVTDNTASYDAEIDAGGAPDTLRVRYPSLCEGTLRLAGILPDNAGAVFSEHLQPNRGVCVDNGTVTLRIVGTGELRYDWRGSQQGQTISGAGVLRRKR